MAGRGSASCVGTVPPQHVVQDEQMIVARTLGRLRIVPDHGGIRADLRLRKHHSELHVDALLDRGMAHRSTSLSRTLAPAAAPGDTAVDAGRWARLPSHSVGRRNGRRGTMECAGLTASSHRGEGSWTYRVVTCWPGACLRSGLPRWCSAVERQGQTLATKPP